MPDARAATVSDMRPESAAVRLGKGKQGRTIVEVSAMTVDDARHYFSELKLQRSIR